MEPRRVLKRVIFIVTLLMLLCWISEDNHGKANVFRPDQGSKDFSSCLLPDGIGPETVEMLNPTERSGSKARCKVSRIGCVSLHDDPPHVFSSPKEVDGNGSLDECASLCWKRGFLVLAFDLRKKCICGGAIKKSYLDPKKLFIYQTAECVNMSLSNIYMVSTCSETNNKQRSSQALFGCFPRSLYAEETFSHISSKMPPHQCLLTCEEKGFLLAIILRKEECFCFNPTLKSGYPKSIQALKPRCNSTSEDFMTVMRTFVEDQRCPPKTFLSSESDLTGLVSYPGSGNTWIRHLIEGGSGIFTGSYYHDARLYRKGYLGEFVDRRSNKVIVTKNHCFRGRCLGIYQKIVFIVRNPYDTILADFNRKYGGGYLCYAKKELFSTTKWTNFVKTSSQKWLQLLLWIVQASKSTHIAFYEDFVANPTREVAKIISFVGVKVANLEQQLLCMEEDLSGEFHRSKSKQNPYTASHVQVVEKAINQAMSACEHSITVKERLSSYSRKLD